MAEKGPAMNSSRMVAFSRQWAMLIAGGINILQSLTILQNQCEDRDLRDCLEQVLRHVSQGHRLSHALSLHSRYFGTLFVAMVRLGEQVGGLNLALLRLSVWQERDQRLFQRWKSALIYPAFVLAVSAVLMFSVFFFVLPHFVEVFESFRMPLPWITRALLWVTKQLHNPLAWLVGGLIGFEGFRQIRLRWSQNKVVWVRLAQRIPGLGSLYRAVTLGRLSLALEASLSVGIPVVQAWSLAATVSACPLLQQDALRVIRCCKDGETLTEALEVSKLYPSTLVELIRAGEETGLMAPLVARAGEFYDQELDYQVGVFTALLEPLLLTGLSLMVMGLILSLLAPLYGILVQLAG